MLRIIVADDHDFVRRGIKQLLQEEWEGAEIAEAQNADEVMVLVRSGVWDLLVLDITMPGRSGLEILPEVRDYQPQLLTLVVSMHPEAQLAQRALKLGASGYLTKDSAAEELIDGVRKILSGGKYLSNSVVERLVYDLQGGVGLAHEQLSNREYEVMCLIASGKTVSQIAQILSLSVKTISTYRARILEKMGMHTNAELTYYAIRNGLVDLG